MRSTFFTIAAIVVLSAVAAAPALAYVMSSTNYRIERDAISAGGGLSTSTSYSSESTVGGFGSGLGTSTAYSLTGGYQQMGQTTISLTVPGATTLTPNINAATGGTSTASTVIGVATNNSSGYTLQIKAAAAPALTSGANSFADYTLAAAAPDYSWSVGTAASEFGYTPQGSHIVTRYLDNGSSCNQAGGSDTSDKCWDPLTTTYNTISQSASANMPSGTNTTVKFQAQVGADATLAAGSYSATIYFTAFAN